MVVATGVPSGRIDGLGSANPSAVLRVPEDGVHDEARRGAARRPARGQDRAADDQAAGRLARCHGLLQELEPPGPRDPLPGPVAVDSGRPRALCRSRQLGSRRQDHAAAEGRRPPGAWNGPHPYMPIAAPSNAHRRTTPEPPHAALAVRLPWLGPPPPHCRSLPTESLHRLPRAGQQAHTGIPYDRSTNPWSGCRQQAPDMPPPHGTQGPPQHPPTAPSPQSSTQPGQPATHPRNHSSEATAGGRARGVRMNAARARGILRQCAPAFCIACGSTCAGSAQARRRWQASERDARPHGKRRATRHACAHAGRERLAMRPGDACMKHAAHEARSA